MHFVIGDLQGCRDAFDRLLAEIGFSPSRHRLHVLGDLVNRGPDNLGVLKRLESFGDAASCLLGNHDLHLLAVAAGVRAPHRSDTLVDVLDSPRRDYWLEWLRRCRMADQAHGWLLVHAGVLPQWDAAQTLALASEVETMLRDERLHSFLPRMYGNQPVRWSDALAGIDRWRMIVNVLTRIRFCTEDGTLDLVVKEGVEAAPPGFKPWFEIQTRRTAETPIAFGHWSTLGLIQRPKLLALDTGCVWGRTLSAARIDVDPVEIIEVACDRAQRPARGADRATA